MKLGKRTDLIFDASSLHILLKRKDLSMLKDSITLDLAFYEVGNALLKELRRRLITEESFAAAVNVLGGISGVMNVVNFQKLEPEKVCQISKPSGLTFYDASYLAFALTLKETLVTNDQKLSEESRKLGIRVISV